MYIYAYEGRLRDTVHMAVQATEGVIAIDGVDVSTIGLVALRSRLAIIPQDPVLFAGLFRVCLVTCVSHPFALPVRRAHVLPNGVSYTYLCTSLWYICRRN